MLNIKTVKNVLVTDETKDGFCFRSLCSQTLSQKKLAGEMADWNSSFTEADYLGMLSVMETIVEKMRQYSGRLHARKRKPHARFSVQCE